MFYTKGAQYGTPAALTPYNKTYFGTQFYTGTQTGSGKLPTGTGNAFFLETQQLVGGTWYPVSIWGPYTP